MKRKSCWRISLIRKRGGFLGYVEAPYEVSAIKQAIKSLGATDPEKQGSFVA